MKAKELQWLEAKASLKMQEYHEMIKMKKDVICDDIERENQVNLKQQEFKREM